jgi:putative transposase
VASRRISTVLALAVPPTSCGTAESGGRDPAIDPPREMREFGLGAPRIHGELLLLGFEIAEPTVSRYLQRLKRIPEESKAKQWLAFLNNHREIIAAFDFFTVPSLSFRTLYCFFAIEHGCRRILQFNATLHPTSDWIVQQLREAFPLPCPYRYVVFDHDAKFGNEVLQFLNRVI